MSKKYSKRDLTLFFRFLNKEMYCTIILAEFSWMNGVRSKLKIKEGRIIIFLGNWSLAIIETWEKLAPVAGYTQLDQISKNPPKKRFLKIVKLTSWTCLTNFEYELK